jgi:hypothetical protein
MSFLLRSKQADADEHLDQAKGQSTHRTPVRIVLCRGAAIKSWSVVRSNDASAGCFHHMSTKVARDAKHEALQCTQPISC